MTSISIGRFSSLTLEEFDEIPSCNLLMHFFIFSFVSSHFSIVPLLFFPMIVDANYPTNNGMNQINNKILI